MAGERIGIVGGGQLGRMLTLAAKPLGFEVTVLEKDKDCPAAQLGADVIVGSLQDEEAINRLAEDSRVVTWEIEHINAEALQALVTTGAHDVQPSPFMLEIINDKLAQKRLLRANGIPVADFWQCDNEDQLAYALAESRSGKVVVKARKGGYDGRANLVLEKPDRRAVREVFGEHQGFGHLYAEDFVAFQKELSVVTVRDKKGVVSAYPVVETVHKAGVCDYVISPARIHGIAADDAHEIAYETVRHLDGAGIFAIEMFLTDEDQILVNEIAPRVHNSGHLTIEANKTSQFQQHIRAITGMPLGSTEAVSPAVMANLLYGPITTHGIARVLAHTNTSLHLYGKEPLPDRKPRKIGHITSLGPTVEHAYLQAIQAREEFYHG